MYCSSVTRSFDFFPEPYKVSWENLEALKKLLGEGFTVEIREDAQAFVVGIRPGHDLVGYSWLDRAEEAFKAAVDAAKAKTEALRAKMIAWKAPILPKPTALTLPLVKVIKRTLNEVEKNIREGDFSMAACYASDADDLIEVMVLVAADDQKGAYRKASGMDTAVRDNIPESIWKWLHQA
jgi:hypothetical protein